MATLQKNYFNKRFGLSQHIGNEINFLRDVYEQEDDCINLMGTTGFSINCATQQNYIKYEFDVKLNNVTDTNKVLISTEIPGTYYQGYSLRLLGDKIGFYMGTGSGSTWNYMYNSQSILVADKWYHIKLIVDITSGKVNVYLDDSLIINGAITKSRPAMTSAFGVGRLGIYNYEDYMPNVKLKNLYVTNDNSTESFTFPTVDVVASDEDSVTFSFNDFSSLNADITKIQIRQNHIITEVPIADGVFKYTIDKGKNIVGLNAIDIVEVFPSGEFTIYTFTYTVDIDNLSLNSTLSEVFDGFNVLNDMFVEKYDVLKDILVEKGIETQEGEGFISLVHRLVGKVSGSEENNRLWLYKDGVEKVEITSFTSGHSGYTYLPITKKEGYIDLSIINRANTFVHLSTKDKIDLTNYSKLKFEIYTDGVYATGYIGNTLSIDSVFNGTSQLATLKINKIGRTVFELDIKNISGSHYVCHSIQRVAIGSISSKVYKIWLEK